MARRWRSSPRFGLRLWDVTECTASGATLENVDSWSSRVVFAPDGRTLAAAGMIAEPLLKPWRLRSGCTRDDREIPPAGRPAGLPDRWAGLRESRRVDLPVSPLAFTRDGRRVLAMQSSAIVAWDAGSGAVQEFIRRESTPSDRLAVARLTADGSP